MATSRIPGSYNPPVGVCTVPSRTPGTLGLVDHGDPDNTSLLGDTPGSLGLRDHADPTLPWLTAGTNAGTPIRTEAGPPIVQASAGAAAQPADPTLWQAWTPPSDYADLYEMLSDPVSGEGNLSHMYLDHKDYVTVGIGKCLKTVAMAKELTFYQRDTSKLATDAEKETDYNAVLAAKPDRTKNPGGFKARYYKQFTKLDMTPKDIGERWVADVKEFQKLLPSYFKGFSSYPAAAKQALTDISYHYGAEGASKTKGRKLKTAAEAADWKAAAELCDTLEGQGKRKEKRKALFMSLVKADAK